ncbi:Immunoglobulin-like domain [Trinorchestia longiramus]|nr:Immunoglobulin-like domain [Trinorchestia longiramus]
MGNEPSENADVCKLPEKQNLLLEVGVMLLVWVLMWLRVCAATDEHLHLHSPFATAPYNSNNTIMGKLPKSKSPLLSVVASADALPPQPPSLPLRISSNKYRPRKNSSEVRRKREIDDSSHNNYNNNGFTYQNSRFNNNNNHNNNNNNNNRNNLNYNRGNNVRNGDTNLNSNDYNSYNNQNGVSGSNNSSYNNNNSDNNNGDQNRASLLDAIAFLRTMTRTRNAAVSNYAPDRGSKRRVREVKWSHLCSPNLLLVFLHQDVSIRCEVWAPLGTIIRWKKDNQTMRTDLYHNEGNENRVDDDNDLVEQLDYSATRQKVQSVFFLDCANYSDMGLFEMSVTSPSGRTYSRFFIVFILENRSRKRGRMCDLLPEMRRLVPRIHAFSRVVYVPLGTSLSLPCHYHGDQMEVTWSRENQRTNQTWTSNGDLLIPAVALSHRGTYICTLQSTYLPHEEYRDRIFTFVQPRPVF